MSGYRAPVAKIDGLWKKPTEAGGETAINPARRVAKAGAGWHFGLRAGFGSVRLKRRGRGAFAALELVIGGQLRAPYQVTVPILAIRATDGIDADLSG